MAPDVTAIERIAERPIGVDPAAIEDEFARVWRETSGSGYDESSLRLRVLNLVAIGKGPDAEDRFERVMAELPARHPCRGILVLLAPDATAVDALISAHCLRGPDGSLDVCSEEVTLTGPPAQQEALSSTVLALLVPEIPVAVWLMDGVDEASYLASEAVEAADVVLGDAAAMQPPAVALRRMLAIAEEHDASVYDLAWGRTETWRALIAQLFDGEERVPQLAKLREVEIEAPGDRLSAEGLLVAGWLVSRLGLTVADERADERSLRATLYAGTRGVGIIVSAGGEPHARLTKVRIRTDDAEFVLAPHQEGRHVHVVERWPDHQMERMVDLPPTDDASIITLDLGAPTEQRVYRDAARAALALLGA